MMNHLIGCVATSLGLRHNMYSPADAIWDAGLMDDYTIKVKTYRERAIELRALAAEVRNPSSHRLLFDVADDYDRMAATIEKIITSKRYTRSRSK